MEPLYSVLIESQRTVSSDLVPSLFSYNTWFQTYAAAKIRIKYWTEPYKELNMP